MVYAGGSSTYPASGPVYVNGNTAVPATAMSAYPSTGAPALLPSGTMENARPAFRPSNALR